MPCLRRMPEITACESLAGETDLPLRVACASMGELEAVRERIDGTDGVDSTRTPMLLATHR